MKEIQKLTLQNISIPLTFQTFHHTNSNSKSVHLSFYSATSVHPLDYAMELGFVSLKLTKGLSNAKYLEENMLAIWFLFHIFLYRHPRMQTYLSTFDVLNFLYD